VYTLFGPPPSPASGQNPPLVLRFCLRKNI
jgi:hypothetical protein